MYHGSTWHKTRISEGEREREREREREIERERERERDWVLAPSARGRLAHH